MATRRWLGTAQNIAQVDTITAALTWATGDTASITVGAITITVTIGTAVATTDVVAAMTAAVNGAAVVGDETRNTTGNLHPEFSWITATTSGSTCILTGDAVGRPFTATVASTTAGTGTWVLANTTAATGKNYWSNVDNWSGGAIPVDADVIVFDHGTVSCLYGLDVTGASLASSTLQITRGYGGAIGLPSINTDTVGAPYAEYRDTYLKTDMGTIAVGQGETGNGSGMIRIDCNSNACNVSVHHTGSSTETGRSAAIFANIATGDVDVYSGDVAFDPIAGQTSTITNLNIGYDTSVTGDARVYVGAGTTITLLTCVGGTNVLNAATITTMEHRAGTTTISGTPLTTATIYGGTVSLTTDVINQVIAGTTWTIGGTGTLDLSRAMQGVTLVNPLDVYGPSARFADPNRNLASAVIDLWHGATVSQLDLGVHNRLTLGTPA